MKNIKGSKKIIDNSFKKLSNELDNIRIENYAGANVETMQNMLCDFNLSLCKAYDDIDTIFEQIQKSR